MPAAHVPILPLGLAVSKRFLYVSPNDNLVTDPPTAKFTPDCSPPKLLVKLFLDVSIPVGLVPPELILDVPAETLSARDSVNPLCLLTDLTFSIKYLKVEAAVVSGDIAVTLCR